MQCMVRARQPAYCSQCVSILFACQSSYTSTGNNISYDGTESVRDRQSRDRKIGAGERLMETAIPFAWGHDERVGRMRMTDDFDCIRPKCGRLRPFPVLPKEVGCIRPKSGRIQPEFGRKPPNNGRRCSLMQMDHAFRDNAIRCR
jgi:hypothetical protein